MTANSLSLSNGLVSLLIMSASPFAAGLRGGDVQGKRGITIEPKDIFVKLSVETEAEKREAGRVARLASSPVTDKAEPRVFRTPAANLLVAVAAGLLAASMILPEALQAAEALADSSWPVPYIRDLIGFFTGPAAAPGVDLGNFTPLFALAVGQRTYGGVPLAQHWDEQYSSRLSAGIGKKLNLKLFIHDRSIQYGSMPIVWESWYWPKGEGVTALVRFGPLFFLEEKAQSRLSPALKRELGANVIWIADFRKNWLGSFFGQEHPLLVITLMLNMDLAGKRLIDAGSGDGLLSLVGAKLGASTLDLIEIDPKSSQEAEKNLKLNGLRIGEHYRVHREDLNNTEAIANSLEQTNNEIVIVSNIGYWPELYSATNAQSIMLIPALQRKGFIVRTFIGGGYALLNEGYRQLFVMEKGGVSVALKQERALVKRYGFRVLSETASQFRYEEKFMAWAATMPRGGPIIARIDRWTPDEKDWLGEHGFIKTPGGLFIGDGNPNSSGGSKRSGEESKRSRKDTTNQDPGPGLAVGSAARQVKQFTMDELKSLAGDTDRGVKYNGKYFRVTSVSPGVKHIGSFEMAGTFVVLAPLNSEFEPWANEGNVTAFFPNNPEWLSKFDVVRFSEVAATPKPEETPKKKLSPWPYQLQKGPKKGKPAARQTTTGSDTKEPNSKAPAGSGRRGPGVKERYRPLGHASWQADRLTGWPKPRSSRPSDQLFGERGRVSHARGDGRQGRGGFIQSAGAVIDLNEYRMKRREKIQIEFKAWITDVARVIVALDRADREKLGKFTMMAAALHLTRARSTLEAAENLAQFWTEVLEKFSVMRKTNRLTVTDAEFFDSSLSRLSKELARIARSAGWQHGTKRGLRLPTVLFSVLAALGLLGAGMLLPELLHAAQGAAMGADAVVGRVLGLWERAGLVALWFGMVAFIAGAAEDLFQDTRDRLFHAARDRIFTERIMLVKQAIAGKSLKQLPPHPAQRVLLRALQAAKDADRGASKYVEAARPVLSSGSLGAGLVVSGLVMAALLWAATGWTHGILLMLSGGSGIWGSALFIHARRTIRRLLSRIEHGPRGPKSNAHKVKQGPSLRLVKPLLVIFAIAGGLLVGMTIGVAEISAEVIRSAADSFLYLASGEWGAVREVWAVASVVGGVNIAEKLLAILGLNHPRPVGDPQVEILRQRRTHDLMIRRIRLRQRAKPAQSPQGLETLQFELGNAATLFDLVYDSASHLIAVIPAPEEVNSSRARPVYFDFSPYHFTLPRFGDPNAKDHWCKLAQAVERHYEMLLDEFEDMWSYNSIGGGDAPSYVYMAMDEHTGMWGATGFKPETFSFIVFQRDVPERHQLIVPLYPKVYSQGGGLLPRAIDRPYYYWLLTSPELKDDHEVLVMWPGMGSDSWFISRRTHRPLWAIGINPFEVANVQAFAEIAGFTVHAMVGDNVIDDAGRPRVANKQFDWVFWEMPAYVDPKETDPDHVRSFKIDRGLAGFWDWDEEGRVLRRFVRGLPSILKPGGRALIWNTPGIEEVIRKMIFEVARGSLEVSRISQDTYLYLLTRLAVVMVVVLGGILAAMITGVTEVSAEAIRSAADLTA